MANIRQNQESRRGAATTAHNETVLEWKGVPARILIGIFAIILAIALSVMDIGFWKTLLLGGGLIILAGKMPKNSRVTWLWPQISRSVGWSIIIITLLLSGFGQWSERKVNNIELAVRCASNDWQLADPSDLTAEQRACQQAAQQKTAKASTHDSNHSLVKEGLGAVTDTIGLTAGARDRQRPQAPAEPIVGACADDRFTGRANCQLVRFGAGTTFSRQAKTGQCLVADPYDRVVRTDLGNDHYDFTAGSPTLVHFFDLPVGASFGSFRCG